MHWHTVLTMVKPKRESLFDEAFNTPEAAQTVSHRWLEHVEQGGLRTSGEPNLGYRIFDPRGRAMITLKVLTCRKEGCRIQEVFDCSDPKCACHGPVFIIPIGG